MTTSVRPRPCCSPAWSRRRSRRSCSCGCARPSARTTWRSSTWRRSRPGRPRSCRPRCSPRCPARRPRRCERWPTAAGALPPSTRSGSRARSCSPASGWPRSRAPSPRSWRSPGRPARGWPGCRGGRGSGVRSRPARCRPFCRAGAAAPTPPPVPTSPRAGGSAPPRCPPRPAPWGPPPTDLPATPGRDLPQMLVAAAEGELSGLLVGGVDPADLPDPALAERALLGADFVVSLEMFPGMVTEFAHVVLPVAAAPEKGGSYLDWEGRLRRFDATLHGTGQLTDARVLQGIVDEMDVDLRLPTVESALAELAALGTGRRPAEGAGLNHAPAAQPALGENEALLASWRQLLDVGTLQRDEPELAGTARQPVARVSAATAARLGLAHGERLTVGGVTGSVTLPVHVTAMPDQVVWLPMRSPGSELRTQLGTAPGGVVRLAVSSPAPTTRGGAR